MVRQDRPLGSWDARGLKLLMSTMVVATVLFSVVSTAAANVVTAAVATTKGSDQFAPAIDGTRVVYTNNAAGNNDIYLFDVVSKKRTRLTSDASDQSRPKIAGDYVVYSDSKSGTPQLSWYSRSAKQHHSLTTGPTKVIEHALYGDVVAYVAMTDAPTETARRYDIMTVSLSSGVARQIATYTGIWRPPYDLAVAGNYVAYSVYQPGEDDDSGAMSLYLGNIAAGSATVVGQGDMACVTPLGLVAYSRSYGDYEPKVYTYNALTNATSTVIEQGANTLGVSDGRLLVKDDQGLWVYSLKAGTRVRIANPKAVDYDQGAAISGTRVVWNTFRIGSTYYAPGTAGHAIDFNVYSAKFSAPLLRIACDKGAEYNKRAVVTGRATTTTGGSYKGRVTLQRSYDRKRWTTVTSRTTKSTGKYSLSSGRVKRKTYFRVKFSKGTRRTTSERIAVTPRAIVSKPVIAADMLAGQGTSISGRVVPALSAGGEMAVSFEKKGLDGAWQQRNLSYAWPVLTKHTGYSSYSHNLTFSETGQWRIRYHATDPGKGIAWGTSAWAYFSVK